VSESPRDRARFIVWLALLTSFGELLLLFSDKFLRVNKFIYLGRDVVPLNFVANLLLFALVGGLLLAIGRRWPRTLTTGRANAVLLFLSCSAVLFGVRGLHFASAGLLAFGLTVVGVRLVGIRETMFAGIVRRSLPVVVIVSAFVGVGAPLWRAVVEARSVRRLPESVPGSPSVLLIVLDTVRADHLGVYGYSRRTSPRLEQLARQSVVFERAVATTSWTLPSHGSMFTGRLPTEMSAGPRAALDGRWPTLAEFLGRRGYTTGGFVANKVYASYEFGVNRGFPHYEDYTISAGELVLSSTIGRTLSDTTFLRRGVGYWHVLGRKRAADVNSEFLSWLSHVDGRPYFAFLNYFDAHEPYDPPAPFNRAFGAPFKSSNVAFSRRDHFAVAVEPEKMSASERQAQIDAYDDGIAYEDDSVGRLLDELAARGRLENTVVIVTSDHGEEFGEHGLFGHGDALFWPLLHVPLIISYPARVPSNRRISDLVSLADLPATVAGLTGPGQEFPFPGTSLARRWSDAGGAVNSHAGVISELGRPHGTMRSVVANNIHYIREGDGVEELYNIASDPDEQRNLLLGEGAKLHDAELARFRCIIRPGCAVDPK
jgi:arylsulfatase A-like enzyme